MIACLSKPLRASGEASKWTPTISILTPPISSGLFPHHYHQAWCMRRRETRAELISYKMLPKCHACDEMRTRDEWRACVPHQRGL